MTQLAHHARLQIGIAKPMGLVWSVDMLPWRAAAVDRHLPDTAPFELGLQPVQLTRQRIAFLLLVASDQGLVPMPETMRDRTRPQRERIAESLGMNEVAFRRFVARSLPNEPGLILTWRPLSTAGRQPSQTGGPWRLDVAELRIHAVDSAEIATEVLQFVERARIKGVDRQAEPEDYLILARHLRAENDWSGAWDVLERAKHMYEVRDRDRRNPVWFDLRLERAEVEMQIGRDDVTPQSSWNILRGVSNQGLPATEVKIIKARAHHVAALIRTQRNTIEGVRQAVQELERAQNDLRGLVSDEATQLGAKIRRHQELTLARLDGVARPTSLSRILEAGRILPGQKTESLMRYGESLLYAINLGRARNYLEAARHEGDLSTPARIITDRLILTSEWAAGGKASTAAERLDALLREARSLGFQHQVRVLREQRRRVRHGDRSVRLRER